MVELMAIVRSTRAAATKAELARIGCDGYSQLAVLGRGRQRGLQNPAQAGGLSFLPKTLFTLVVEESRADETIEAVIRANQTGEFGDGKIFLIEMTESYRISTGECQPAKQAAEVSAS